MWLSSEDKNDWGCYRGFLAKQLLKCNAEINISPLICVISESLSILNLSNRAGTKNVI